MNGALTVAQSGSAECAVVHLVGELDTASVPTLRDTVFDLLTGPSRTLKTIRLDLAELTFCDSSGIAVFLRLADAARDAGVHLAFGDPRPAMRRLFARSGVDQYLDRGDTGLESTA